jgi:hypothetical protein
MQSGTNVSLKHTAFTIRASSILKMKEAHPSETKLHGITSQKTVIFLVITVRTANLVICQGFRFTTLFTVTAVVK